MVAAHISILINRQSTTTTRCCVSRPFVRLAVIIRCPRVRMSAVSSVSAVSAGQELGQQRQTLLTRITVMSLFAYMLPARFSGGRNLPDDSDETAVGIFCMGICVQMRHYREINDSAVTLSFIRRKCKWNNESELGQINSLLLYDKLFHFQMYFTFLQCAFK